ncbi:MAG: hypothetical protein AAF602_22535 [Myxococcota bacterium]
MLMFLLATSHAADLDFDARKSELVPRIEKVAGRAFQQPVALLVDGHDGVGATLGVEPPPGARSGYHADGVVYVLSDVLIGAPGAQQPAMVDAAATCTVAEGLVEALFAQNLGSDYDVVATQTQRRFVTEAVCGSAGNGTGAGWYRAVTRTIGLEDPRGATFDPTNPVFHPYLRRWMASKVAEEGPSALWSSVGTYPSMGELTSVTPSTTAARQLGRDVLTALTPKVVAADRANPLWHFEMLGEPGFRALPSVRGVGRFKIAEAHQMVEVLEFDDPAVLRGVMAARLGASGMLVDHDLRLVSYTNQQLPYDDFKTQDRYPAMVMIDPRGKGLRQLRVKTAAVPKLPDNVREAVRVASRGELGNFVHYQLWVATESLLFVVRTLDEPGPNKKILRRVSELAD